MRGDANPSMNPVMSPGLNAGPPPGTKAVAA